MTSLSYQEKSLYGTLAANLIVYIPYFVFVARHAALTSIVQTITILVVLQIILQSVIAIFSRSRLTDERDREVEARGYRAGYFALITGVLVVLTSLWAHALTGFADPGRDAIHFINALFGALVLAELVKTITQLVTYRVGA
jgi:dolichol kinase